MEQTFYNTIYKCKKKLYWNYKQTEYETQNMLISEMLRDVLIGHNFTQNIQILYC